MRMLLHALARIMIRVIFGVATGAPIEEAQCIVAANHNTHIDAFALFMLFRLERIKRVHAVAAEDYFSRGAKGAVARYLFNAILIRRGGGAAALDPVRDALRRGESIVVFPEGSRGKPGEMAPFKSGIGMLAVEFPDIPILLVALRGIERTLPKDTEVPVPFSFECRQLPATNGRELMAACGEDRKAIARELQNSLLEALHSA
jgi:1-acyl-sn-glycerol-3-phosphate acyltransferase